MWATGGAPDLAEAERDAEKFGIPELADRLNAAGARDQGFGVWRQNWDIVIAFLAVSTQWRVIPLASGATYWQGLDYTAAKVGLEQAGITLSPSQWSGLRTMEGEAARAMNGVRG